MIRTKPPIVLVHGLWLTPRAWEHWFERYAAAGHEVVAPAWPGMEVGVDALRRNPSVMNNLGVMEVADHYDKIVRNMDAAPIIIGHSFGGAIVQILLDRGLGSAGVAIHPAPVKGGYRLPLSALRSSWPVLRNPGNRKRTVALTPKQWRYAFANTASPAEASAAYVRYHVPAPGLPLWQSVKVNLRNDDRAPLLIIAGGKDHTVPASVARAALGRYGNSRAVTELKVFPDRSHWTIGEPGWEKVADFAHDWVLRHTVSPVSRPPIGAQ